MLSLVTGSIVEGTGRRVDDWLQQTGCRKVDVKLETESETMHGEAGRRDAELDNVRNYIED